MRRFVSIFLCFVFLLSFCSVSVCAATYSREYPADASYNSGGPIWLHCEVETLGEILVIIDPNTNLSSFGFDSPNGVNLINNTSSTIKGRAYIVGGLASYAAQWPSFYKLQLQTGMSSTGQRVYVDYDVVRIIGTTLNLIDYTELDRGNDFYDNDIPSNQIPIIIISILLFIALSLVVFKIVKPRVIRM